MILVNLGCGATWHSEWRNYDLHSASPSVLRFDVANRLPLADLSCDVVYHSHLLEHIDRRRAKDFMAECFRVLKRGGTMRVVVPDLERSVRHYVDALESALDGRDSFAYELAMIELYDLAVRYPGEGQMQPFIDAATPEQLAFIESRIGPVRRKADRPPQPCGSSCSPSEPRGGNLNAWLTKLRRRAPRVRERIEELALRTLGDAEAVELLRLGEARASGNVHLWMYDRYSLATLLRTTGMEDVRQCAANESRIPGYARYELDVVDGQVRRTDSLFMEGIRP